MPPKGFSIGTWLGYNRVETSNGKSLPIEFVKRFILGAPIFFAIMACGTGSHQRDLPSVPAPNNSMRRASAHRIFAEGLPNFAEVTPRLYRGGQPTTTGFHTLARMGISIVVDGRGGSRKRERDEVTKHGMRYVAIPWHCPFPKDSVFARFLSVIRQSPDKKIFVHCRLGDDRAGMMIAAYRMAEEGWTAKEAMQEMKAYGFTLSHHLICPGLARYEKNFPRRYKTNPVFRSLR